MCRFALLTIVGVVFVGLNAGRADEPAAPMSQPAMTVKVYAVPDLLAAADAPQAGPNPLPGNSEMAEALQQIQLQAQLIQASVQAAQNTAAAEPASDVVKKLERLKKALRIAAPKDSWTENGGDGEIEVYPDALSLIVRQTPAGHEAIADLLTQLRAAQSVYIELTVELLSLHGVEDEVAAELMLQLLNHELSEEELARFRQIGAKTVLTNVVQIANGRSTNTALPIGLPVEMTAVASVDRSTVEFRSTMKGPYDDDVAMMRQALAQSRTVSVGKSMAYVINLEGLIALVTPKIVDRSPAAVKEGRP